MKQPKPTKYLTEGQRLFNNATRGTPTPPVQRTPAPLPPLNPGERVQERAEERRFTTGWRERRHNERA